MQPGKTYGSTDDASCISPRPTAAWHDWGTPGALLLAAAIGCTRQFMALGLIVADVIFSRKHLMGCNPEQVGVPMALFCEYSKAYVRCFPLLSLTVSLMVVSRQLLQHRMYYEMLRHGVLLDLDNFWPLSDPLFRIILWCALNACSHFIVNIWRGHNQDFESIEGSVHAINDQELHHDVERVAVFYIVPTVFFLVFLYGSYDTEAVLLPLSKYFEDDPETARKELARIPFVTEITAATAVQADLFGPEPVRNDAQLAEAHKRLLEESQVLTADPDRVAPMSDFRLVATLWPAQFLLHSKLQETRSLRFRYMFYAFSVFSAILMWSVFVWFNSLIVNKTEDVLEGQFTDITGLVVIVAHALITGWLAVCFLKNATVPFRT